jgi:hypothetical protein
VFKLIVMPRNSRKIYTKTREFVVDIGNMHFDVEVNRTEQDDVFLFCKPMDKDEHRYFFMGQDISGRWVILSKFVVPKYILALESVLSEKIATMFDNDTHLQKGLLNK